jgi:GNAT superfamily N-acetyltransferase
MARPSAAASAASGPVIIAAVMTAQSEYQNRPAGLIRPCRPGETEVVWHIINEAAQAYRDVIPPDRWHDPYMSLEELQQEIAAGVAFWGYEEGGELLGVMGIQAVRDVTLIRHAYVRRSSQGRGIGGRLLAALRRRTSQPILIGTWAAATWAVRFYEKHGFRQVSFQEKERLLRSYWSVPTRQIETSVVLAEQAWFERQGGPG